MGEGLKKKGVQRASPCRLPRWWPGLTAAAVVAAAPQHCQCRSCKRPQGKGGLWCLGLGRPAPGREGNGLSPQAEGERVCRQTSCERQK